MKIIPDFLQNFKIPWKSVLTSMPVIAFVLTHMLNSYGFLLLSLNVPRFLREAMHINMNEVRAITYIYILVYKLPYHIPYSLISLVDWLPFISTISGQFPLQVDLCAKLFLCGASHSIKAKYVSSYIVYLL